MLTSNCMCRPYIVIFIQSYVNIKLHVSTLRTDLWNQFLSPLMLSVHGEVYSVQHYVITFVSDLRQISGFLWVLWLPPPIKLPAMLWYNWNIVESGIKHHKPKPLIHLLNQLQVFMRYKKLPKWALISL
jgi:hypothetical protein